jgi:hypothetical protein
MKMQFTIKALKRRAGVTRRVRRVADYLLEHGSMDGETFKKMVR